MLQTLFERSLNIAHDMGMTSIAFPMIGCGNLGFSPTQVMAAVLDACSLFHMRSSSLVRVDVIVYERDLVTQQVSVYFYKYFRLTCRHIKLTTW